MNAPIIELSGNRFQAFINFVAQEGDASRAVTSTIGSFMHSKSQCEIEAVNVSTYAVPTPEGTAPSERLVGLMISIVVQRLNPQG